MSAGSRQLILRAAAQADLREAHRWYEAQREGLGRDFLDCVDECFASVLRAPETRRCVLQNRVRRAAVRRFPYGVFYLVRADAVVVIGVIHAARDPNVWRRRA